MCPHFLIGGQPNELTGTEEQHKGDQGEMTKPEVEKITAQLNQ